jgi:hypothetical protein
LHIFPVWNRKLSKTILYRITLYIKLNIFFIYFVVLVGKTFVWLETQLGVLKYGAAAVARWRWSTSVEMFWKSFWSLSFLIKSTSSNPIQVCEISILTHARKLLPHTTYSDILYNMPWQFYHLRDSFTTYRDSFITHKDSFITCGIVLQHIGTVLSHTSLTTSRDIVWDPNLHLKLSEYHNSSNVSALRLSMA